ncbi:MAG: hypothetical protein HOV87_00365 [Catenulispora sp.]|nr:hypothetical protein [Catenulispora sp.]
MPLGAGKDERKPSAKAVQAAEEKSLGTLIETYPLQKRTLLKFKDTGHLVHRYEKGLVDSPRTGYELPAAMRYDQISSVRQSSIQHYINGFYNRTSFGFAITSMAGEVIRWEGSFFDQDVSSAPAFSKGDPRLPQFGAKLAERVSEARLPAHVKALNEGKALVFGAIVISREGVRVQDSVVPWSQVEPLATARGAAVVQHWPTHKPLVRTNLGAIPNLPLFLTLFEELRRGRLV